MEEQSEDCRALEFHNRSAIHSPLSALKLHNIIRYTVVKTVMFNEFAGFDETACVFGTKVLK